MKTEVKTEMFVTLTLTADEARWLKGMVQNGSDLPADYEMREKFFNALPSFQQLSGIPSA